MPTLLARRSAMVRTFGLVLALVGLLGLLSFGDVAQRRDDAAAAVVALSTASIDCHLLSSAHDGRSRHQPHRTEPSLCPAQLVLAQPAITVAPATHPASAVRVVALRTTLLPPSRGPPQATARVGEPRAPPAQV